MPDVHDFEIDTLEGGDVFGGPGGKGCWNTHGRLTDPGVTDFGVPPTACVPGTPLTTGFHTYGALWTPSGVTFYYDGVQVGVGRAGIHSTASQQFLVMDIINFHHPAIVASKELLVDSVHVWQPDGDGDGLTGAADACPTQAGPASNNGCPVPHAKGDYVNDGKADFVLCRGPGSVFLIKDQQTGAEHAQPFGSDGDKPISGDFVGSGKSDLALYRAAGSYFLIKNWADGGAEHTIQLGQTGDIPVPADYIGDSKTDIAVFRPSTNQLLVRTLGDPMVHAYTWGSPCDVPIIPYGTNY